MSRCKADPASAGPGSSNMEEQGESGGEGSEVIESCIATFLTLSRNEFKIKRKSDWVRFRRCW